MKYYLFDFDGTLVDSMPTYGAMMIRILEESNVPYPENVVKIITPLGFKGTAEYFRNTLGHPLSAEELLWKMYRYAYEAYATSIPAKEHVEQALALLKKRGASLSVLTASPHKTLDVCLTRLGLTAYFDNVWSCDDFSTTKADPAIYRMAAERMGAAVEEVLFLDDNYHADKTAKEAGMRVCGVFDPSSMEYEAQMRELCDFYIRDFSALPDLA